jgi:cell division protein FtsL
MYQYTNVAVKYQNERKYKPKPRPRQVYQPNHQPQSIPLQRPLRQPLAQPVRKGVSALEKVSYLVMVMILIVGATLLMSRHVHMTEMNYQIQYLEREHQAIVEQNNTLKLTVAEYSSADRIIAKAGEMGLVSKESTVKVLSIPAYMDNHQRTIVTKTEQRESLSNNYAASE